MPVEDPRPCTSCGLSLSDCYDRPRYKGRLACCDYCDHPSAEQKQRAEALERVRRAAREKLTPEEREVLGLSL